METQPNYDKLLEPIADITTSIETLLDGAFGGLMGDQREGLKRTYAAAWGLHTLFLDIVTNIGIENIARRSYLPQKFNEFLDPLVTNTQNLLDGIDGPLTEEQTISVEFIHITGVLLRHYVDNLCLFSQLEHNLYAVDKQITVIETILDPMQWAVPENQIALELLIPQDMPEILVDTFLMQHAVKHIVENAVNNTVEGYIRVTASANSDAIEIIVSDSGCGIPLAYHQDIFIPFFQVDTHSLGLGLGLPTVRHILKLHKGYIHISSGLVGLTVTLQIPR